MIFFYFYLVYFTFSISFSVLPFHLVYVFQFLHLSLSLFIFLFLGLHIFSPFIFISWRLITLQYCSGFCHTLTWISHGFTCIPYPDLPSHLPLHPIPLGLPSAPGLTTCLMHPTWAGDLFHPWLYTCFDAVLSNIPPSPSTTESKSLFYTSVSLFLFCIHGYHYHLSKFHIYVLVYYIGLYLSGLLTLYNGL